MVVVGACLVKTCLVKKVLEQHAIEYSVQLYRCFNCEQWMCTMCCKNDVAFEFHKMTYPEILLKQIEPQRIRQYLYFKHVTGTGRGLPVAPSDRGFLPWSPWATTSKYEAEKLLKNMCWPAIFALSLSLSLIQLHW